MTTEQFLTTVCTVQNIAENNKRKYSQLTTNKLDIKMIDSSELLTLMVEHDNFVVLDCIVSNIDRFKCIANLYYIL